MTRANDTDPNRRPPLGAADTAPDPVDVQDDRAAEMLLQGFDRTPVPPAPRPERGASSDGRSFVQHYAVTRSATGTKRANETDSVVVRRELGRILAEVDGEDSTQHEGLVASRDEKTHLVTARRARRRRAIWLVSGVVALGLVLLFAAFMQTSETTPALATSAPTVTASAAPLAASAPATPLAVPASVQAAPPTLPTTQPTVLQAPPSARPLPAKSATPKASPRSDGEFELTLPR
jgi:hypothetical protein